MEQVQTIKYSKQKNKFRIGFIIATIVVLVGAFTMIFPYLWMLFTSFKSNHESYAAELTLLPKEWLIDAYEGIIGDPKFYESIFWTLVVAIFYLYNLSRQPNRRFPRQISYL